MTKDQKIYKLVVERDNHSCRICGSNQIQIHHIWHRSRGGMNTPENLICLCKRHHDEVHTDEKKWREILTDMQRGIYPYIENSDMKEVIK